MALAALADCRYAQPAKKLADADESFPASKSWMAFT